MSAMKQWVVQSKENDFDGLVYQDAPVPNFGENEVLVRLQAASLNYRDLIIPKGKYPFPCNFPVVPASDGAGEVVEVGSKVTEFKKGDKVATLFNQGHQYGDIDITATQTGLGGVIDGALRQYGVFNERGLVKAAKNLTPLENSTLSCAALTSWNALYGLKPLKPGQVVLVQGTGGVSMFALQFAKAAGATVIATTSSDQKADKLRKLGADHIINYRTDLNWGETARKLTPDGCGVDYVIEVGGPGTLTQSFKCIKFEGVISVIGFLGGVKPQGEPAILDTLNNICTVRGVYVGSKALMRDMIRAIEANDIHPVVDEKVFTLDQAREAYEYMWAQKHFGHVKPLLASLSQLLPLIPDMQANTRDTICTLPVTASPQKPLNETFIRPVQMSLFSRVTCYPPLGQVTCLQRTQKATQLEQEEDTVRFTVVIESSTSFPTQRWEAQIWHNITGSEWSALPLHESWPSQAPLLNQTDNEYAYHRYVLSEAIQLPASGGYVRFTVRFRPNPDAEWQWANQKQPIGDGELVFSPRHWGVDKPFGSDMSLLSPKDELSKYLDCLSSEVQVNLRTSEAPGSILWSISGSVDRAKNGVSCIKQFALGIPSSITRFFSLIRVWSPWLGPRHGKDIFRLTEDAILCSFLRKDGTNLLFLAISGTNDILTVFQSGADGELVVKSRSDNPATSEFHVLAAVADNFEVALSAVIYEARKVVRPFRESANQHLEQCPLSPLGDDIVVVEKDPEAQWLTEWYDGLTYCTWDGLGQNLTEEKILHALDSLKSHGINITNLIIDDNWQSVDNEKESQFKRRWERFDANPKAFPRGLKNAVEKIRRAHPNIGHIAVWHALLGYWGGICPSSDLAKRYKTKEVRIKDPSPDGPIAHNLADGKFLAIDPEDIERFYDEFYSYLASAGIDGVKTDAQCFLDFLEDSEDRKRFLTSYQDAWSIVSLRHFSTRSISCMSLIPQIIFHSLLPTNKPTIPLRNSDDFFPKIPASHPWHIFCNAHNALFTRFLNALPDWDMFQTNHPYASFHAAARCISGGPIHITDEPGKHDLSVIDQMTAPTVQGSTIILRPSVVGRTIDVYNGYDEGRVLRVGSYTGRARTGSGIMGLFNIHSAEASCIVSLKDFPGVHQDSNCEYVVRSHTSGKVTGRMRSHDKDSLVSIILKEKEWEILTAYPIHSFGLGSRRKHCNSDSNTLHVAILGLIGKMTGAAAVASSDILVAENGRLRFDIHLKALGTLGIYISNLQDLDISSNFMVMILGRPIPQRTVSKQSGEKSNVLAIDVLSAWKEMKLDSGWSNEAFVQVFVS
ncbi:hypothetical protein N7462_008478 [Penicillium macrosclerotiorum]|uniref:uncharacterized protein n=1 Tax=Penicillium macrosclerotiorum TaxID=303699 RepID=UPI00254822A3|nr:uncharacterized protein N7462_008478 [Penicillium macrosclerotiorum]KAJ5675581.1 hypothetical protein N7462_008478 [Penicillium macrosclerotiorum]